MLTQFPVGLTKQQKKYLEDKSEKTGFKIAHLIRELINKDMKGGE